MKKTLKRVLATLLTVVMILTAAPMFNFVGLELSTFGELFNIKAKAASYSGTCGDNLTWTFDDETAILTVSGTGAMYDFDYNNRPWESNIYQIKSVVIGNSVTTIGVCAFYECASLTSITLPDSVTSIGDNAFTGCFGLTSLTIPDGVTRIGVGAFYNCTGLTSVTLPDSVTSVGYFAFSLCTGLTSIIIGKGVTLIDAWAFYCSDKLKDVYYTGSEDDWNKISIESSNESLLNATIHFNYDSTHSYGYNIFSYYQAEHPHYAVYKCECGAESVTTQTTMLDTCITCYPLQEKTLHSISVKSMPYTTEYKYNKNGTELDTNGLVIEAAYSDTSKKEIDNSLIEFTGFDTSSRGTKTVTATYEGQSVTFDVEVKFTFGQWLLYIFCFGWIWV